MNTPQPWPNESLRRNLSLDELIRYEITPSLKDLQRVETDGNQQAYDDGFDAGSEDGFNRCLDEIRDELTDEITRAVDGVLRCRRS